MSEDNAVSNDYLKLQQELVDIQNKWMDKLTVELAEKEYNNQAPILSEVEFQGDLTEYREFLFELIDYLQNKKPNLEAQLNILREQLNSDIHKKWLQETIRMNDFYFGTFAEENQVEEWLVIFLAEGCARVYMRSAVKQLENQLTHSKVKSCCPACGEPPRLAIVGKKGGKELLCPRCHHTWDEKKISCAYCETDDHDQIVILKPEGQEREEIHACKSCNGYTKVIDTRAMFKKDYPEIIDLKTIHLDYIAQEEGYGLKEDQVQS